MFGFAEETGEVGADLVNHFVEGGLGGVVENEVDVLVIGFETIFSKHFGQAGADEFFFALVKIDAAVLIDQPADAHELFIGEDGLLNLEGWELHSRSYR